MGKNIIKWKVREANTIITTENKSCLEGPELYKGLHRIMRQHIRITL